MSTKVRTEIRNGKNVLHIKLGLNKVGGSVIQLKSIASLSGVSFSNNLSRLCL